ncbi:KpsF/GutQ family sugar-phosphate isomerase [Sulfuriroseicoccus oceanibius]|uniref:KpsF/GutQ family sugar-phosphate isomerase n=1 Tax=Sulfuriroseicoccus oceanibius TaxID=2707525 RepID=A0A6B3L3G3_9BACT|nr:KpsF/GutQ family sugar-phosphate isomerase [Sulfuriroseicoccus oceanibius]QQL45615.1 KpsF/GutQ family sugar-phosphate isomerase [Sulfuriroseicoccus oceanibius]
MSERLPDPSVEAARVFDAEIAALHSVRDSVLPTFNRAVELILEASGKVVVTGLGKSGLIGRKIAATMASTGRTATFINAADALHGDLGMVARGDVVLMLSNSAATNELVLMMPTLRRLGVKVIGIFGETETELARSVDVVLHARISAEGCPLELAPMSSSTAALVVGDALAAALMKDVGFSESDFALYHPAGSLGRRLLLTAEDVMHRGESFSVVTPETSFRELVSEMTRTNLGAVCVENGDGTLAGVITDGDVRRTIMREDPFQLVARDIMTENPVTIRPQAKLAEVLAEMEMPKRRIYVIPVVDDEQRIAGLVRMHDIVR